MCLLIVNRAGLLPKSTFQHAWTANPDGFGMAYLNGTVLTRYKNLQSWKAAYYAYATIRQANTGAMLLHFRYGTHGGIDLENCHPFQINDNLVFAHNGIIDIESDDPRQSDTAAFCDLLRGLPDGFLDNPSLCQMIGMAIGNSKLAFLDRQGLVTIIHEELGHAVGPNWFSNTSYLAPQPAPRFFSRWRYTPTQQTKTAIRDGLLESCNICGQSDHETNMIDTEDDAWLCESCAEQIGYTWHRYNKGGA